MEGLPFLMIPVRFQLIALSSFLRVAENFVGRVDFLGLFFGNCLVYGNLDDLLVCGPVECHLEFLAARVSHHSEKVVVVLEFNEPCLAPGNGPDRSQ